MEKNVKNPRLTERLLSFDVVAWGKQRLQRADIPFWHAFFSLFIGLNLIFLYHGAHFLFGDHDWRYLKDGVSLGAGLFEGRFTQFLAINMLSLGQILPLINNLLGFAGFSLGIVLLAKYWEIPHNKTAYTLFALFTGVTPFILSFMYFAFLIIPILSWNAFIVGGLLLASAKRLDKQIAAVILFTLALGGYPPVINLFCVVLCTKLLLQSLKDGKIGWQSLRPLGAFAVAILCYKLCLKYFISTGAINASYYNLQILAPADIPAHIILVLQTALTQFFATLPFILAPYKILTFFVSLIAVTVVFKSKTDLRKIVRLFLLLALIFAPLITLFLSPSVKETLHAPRIDFFGLLYVYAAFLALTLTFGNKLCKNLTVLLATLSIFYSSVTLFEAQKVWHFGFTTEMSLFKRVIKTYEARPDFLPHGKYAVIQAGSPAFRHKFYQESFRFGSDDLLGVSYVPGMNGGVMINYYAPYEYADETSHVYSFAPTEEFYTATANAPAYPKDGSIRLGRNWIYFNLNTPTPKF